MYQVDDDPTVSSNSPNILVVACGNDRSLSTGPPPKGSSHIPPAADLILYASAWSSAKLVLKRTAISLVIPDKKPR